VRGIGQKIPLRHQLANLGMQSINLSRAHLFGGGASARKSRRHIFYRCALPRANLGGVNAILLGKFRQRNRLADCFKRNAGLELRRMVLSFLHSGSLPSSCDPLQQLVRMPATTSIKRVSKAW